jgi:hypothetical protein
MHGTKTARKLRNRIGRFSGELSKGLGLPAQRFVSEMVYGIQASESVLLTEIGRTLEEPIPLRKTQWRLSRNLQRPELEDVVQQNVLRMAAPRIQNDTLLIVDPSDIAKKYAKTMEYLATVRDGSEHDLAKGYWTLHVMGAELGGDTMVPLYQRLWSADAPDFESENEEILRAVDAVQAHAGTRGIWVYDRGGDRINLFDPLLERGARFLIRQRGDRHLLCRGQTLLAKEIARTCPCPHRTFVSRIEGARERHYELRFGFRRVKLPEREEPLNLLVIRGFGVEPLMLLTTEPLSNSFKRLWWFVRAYMKRWSIEETIRYVKQCYDLENVRVLNYQGLQNLMPLLLAVMFFCACVLDHDARLRVMAGYVERAAKRLFGIPDFKYYALADGLRALFTRHPGAPITRIRDPGQPQLPLFALDTS